MLKILFNQQPIPIWFGFFLGMPGMARIQLEISQPRVFTAKCSEPQVVNSDVEDGGSGVAILPSVRTETG